jgi:hypothetical protein
MNQASKIESIITDINLMDWDDDLHDKFEQATDALETLLIALWNIGQANIDDGGRDTQQERADYMESQR